MANAAPHAHTSWPWRITGGGVELCSPDNSERVTFTQSGVTHHADGTNELFAWSSIREFSIELPTATLWGGRVLAVFDMIGPKPIDMSPEEVHVAFTAGYRVVEWTT